MTNLQPSHSKRLPNIHRTSPYSQRPSNVTATKVKVEPGLSKNKRTKARSKESNALIELGENEEVEGVLERDEQYVLCIDTSVT